MIEVSFWLVPSAEDREHYQHLIDCLARDYGSRPFVPHVTVYSGPASEHEALDSLGRSAAATGPLTLTPVRTEVSGQFTKTFTIAFRESQDLSRLCERLREGASKPSDYALCPHLSLLYRRMPPGDLKRLGESEEVRLAPITFDELWAVHTPTPVETPEDVVRWKVIGKQEIG